MENTNNFEPQPVWYVERDVLGFEKDNQITDLEYTTSHNKQPKLFLKIIAWILIILISILPLSYFIPQLKIVMEYGCLGGTSIY